MMNLADVCISVLGIAGAMAVSYLTWRRSLWGVALVLATVPLQAYAVIGREGTGPTWTQAWLWSLIATSALLWAGGCIRIPIDLPTLLYGGVVVAYAMSRVAATDEALWRAESYRWLASFLLFVCARSLVRPTASAWPLVAVSMVGLVWTNTRGVMQRIGDLGPESFERGGIRRAYAAFGEPNPYGAFAVLAAAPLIALLMAGPTSRRELRTLVGFGGLGLAFLALFLSLSRGAALGLVGAFTLLLAAWIFQAGRVVRSVAVVVALAGCLLTAPLVAERLTRVGEPTNVTTANFADLERETHWRTAHRMLREHPVTGIGAGQYNREYREQTTNWRFRIPRGHAHSTYLHVAAETGLVGTGAYLALVVTLVYQLVRTAWSDRRAWPAWAALAMTGAWSAHGLVDYLHVLNLGLLPAAWWAVALPRARVQTSSTERSDLGGHH
jgi:O-antigen ligase